MRLLRVIKFILPLTILSLVYIHMQMRIIELAYQSKTKENEIQQLTEANENINYTILTLKSANNLGIKMLSEHSDMHFMDPLDIMRVATPEAMIRLEPPIKNKNPNKIKVLILGLLSIGP